MDSPRKNIFLAVGFVIVFIALEVLSFVFLKFYYWQKDDNAFKPFDKIIATYVSRVHPLFVNNEDLRKVIRGIKFDPILGYRFTPNSFYAREYSTGKSILEVDANGFIHNGDRERNGDLFDEHSDSLYRIVFMGGSTIAGRGATNNTKTIPAKFERIIQARWPGIKFHVINAGVFGYQTTQERLYYSYYIKNLQPDLLIFLDGTNDAFSNGRIREWQAYHSEMSLDEEKLKYLRRPYFAFQNFVSSLFEFPQSFYSFFLVKKIMSKARVLIYQSGIRSLGETKEFSYHPQGARQMQNNLLQLANDISVEQSRGAFYVQPNLSFAKEMKSNYEQYTYDQMNAIYADFSLITNQYFDDFVNVYETLNEQFLDNKKVSFRNLRTIFVNEEKAVYQSVWHYNDYGNSLIAHKIFDDLQNDIEIDLITKALVR